MTGLRRPEEDAVVPAADAARIRQVLVTCSGLLSWAEAICGPQFTAAEQDAAQAAGFSRAPGALAYEVNLAIDTLDFADAARSAR
jgi:LAS superfamily LD-carboxypeptidase LdcB